MSSDSSPAGAAPSETAPAIADGVPPLVSAAPLQGAEPVGPLTAVQLLTATDPLAQTLDASGPADPLATTLPAPAVPAQRPSFLFFGIVSGAALLLDIASKAWAEIVLTARLSDEPSIVIVPNHLELLLAYNKGGAWGLLQDSSEAVRLPFFLAVSVLAILFIVSLYGKLVVGQKALQWGLPLVLGGALGNLSDRITRASVIDFIDYRADWVLSMNRTIAKVVDGWALTEHWPTFNVADIAICIGVGFMGIDMFTARRAPRPAEPEPAPLGASNPPNA